MIAPSKLVKAVGHWKPAGRVHQEAIKLQKQGMGYNEALEIAMHNPKHWEGYESYR